MSRRQGYAYRFVDQLPDELDDGVLYVSIAFSTVAHRCFCGCGEEVVTPLSPTDWRLIFDGESISLEPSIGSWSLPCRSHYWLTDNRVEWAAGWSQQQIDRGRYLDRLHKRDHFHGRSEDSESSRERQPSVDPVKPSANRSWWERLLRWRSPRL